MIQGKDILFLSEMDWDDLWTRKQQFAKMFGENQNRVLYVEPHESWPFLLRKRKLAKILRSFWFPIRVEKNLWRISPWPGLPFDGLFSSINRINNILLKFQLLIAFFILRIRPELLFVYMPQNHPLVGKLREKASVYDIVDERYEYPGRHRKTYQEREKALFQKVDLVTVVSQNLAKSKASFHSEIHLIPNAAELPLFAKAQDPDTAESPILKGLPKPRLGFIGGIYPWVDFELLRSISRAYPQGSIILVGPTGKSIDRLSDCANVRWIPRQRQLDLPGFLKGFDCCLIPYKMERLKQFSDPLKVYEYLAAGKPVAAMNMPALENFAPVIKTANTHQEFLAAIKEALQNDSPALIRQRMEWVKDHGWASRFAMLNALCEKLIDQS